MNESATVLRLPFWNPTQLSLRECLCSKSRARCCNSSSAQCGGGDLGETSLGGQSLRAGNAGP